MIGRISIIVAAVILSGWLYWLTARVQVLLTHAEAALDRADRTLAAAQTMIAAVPPAAVPSTAPPSTAPPAPAPRSAAPPSAAPPATALPPASGPPTVPTGIAIEAEKRALVERAFPVHGAPRRFTFKTSDDGSA